MAWHDANCNAEMTTHCCLEGKHSLDSSQPTGTDHGVISSLGATMWLQQTHKSGVIHSISYQVRDSHIAR